MSGAKTEQYGAGIDLDVHALSQLTSDKVPQTDDSPKYNYSPTGEDPSADYGNVLLFLSAAVSNVSWLTVFDGCVGRVLAIRKTGEFVDEVRSGDECGLILDRTCFYAEQGGQTFDQGFLTKEGDEVS